MSYAVEVERRAARLVDAGGSSREVVFFLHTVRKHDYRHESLADRLNDLDARFVPCEIDGRIELLQIDWIVYVEPRGRLPEFDRLVEEGAIRTLVEVDLVTGESLRGALLYEAPIDNDRVSDLLNTRADRFLALQGEGWSRLVRCGAITRLRF